MRNKRTDEERLAYQREYYNTHKEQRLKYQNKYNQEVVKPRTEQIKIEIKKIKEADKLAKLELIKQIKENHCFVKDLPPDEYKEHIRVLRHKYYNKHRDEINLKRRIKYHLKKLNKKEEI